MSLHYTLDGVLADALTFHECCDLLAHLKGSIGYDPNRGGGKARMMGDLQAFTAATVAAACKTLGIPEKEKSTVPPDAVWITDGTQTHAPTTTHTTTPKKEAPKMGTLAEQIAALIESNTPQIDIDQIRTIVAEEVSKIAFPQRIELKRLDGVQIDCGVTHKTFAQLLAICSASRQLTPLNLWLHGAAGSGKTTAAMKAAEALGLSFFSNGALMTQYEVIGFTDANGNTKRTPFRDAWENGGVWLWDEIDSSEPRAVMALNAALANGFCSFPDGQIKRHKDCVILAGANTLGTGASVEYSARSKLDASSADRWVFLEWETDEALELATAPNEAWTKHVQKLRKALKAAQIKGAMITPRASYQGAALLAAGLNWAQVEELAIKKTLTTEQWGKVVGAAA